jgi:PAS domain S-box-containing protein
MLRDGGLGCLDVEPAWVISNPGNWFAGDIKGLFKCLLSAPHNLPPRLVRNFVNFYMQRTSGSNKRRYLIFIVSVILTIVATQVIVQYDLKNQNSDASLINVAGRQRMLSQRISKLTLFIFYESLRQNDPWDYKLDSLEKLVDRWEGVHFYLIDRNEKETKSKAIDFLLKSNTKYLKQITEACRDIINTRDTATLKKSIERISRADLPYLMTMEKTVATYQREAEVKLSVLKQLELALSLIAILILICEFTFIILPIFYQLQTSNRKLSKSNSELTASNGEVQRNLEQIRKLQHDLEIKQHQYQGLVDEASDMIYELNAEGKFSFVNPVLEETSGFKKDHLLDKPYWDLVSPEERNAVISFYNTQRKTGTEVSYLEFRMQARDGTRFWIGQNVRMFFNGKWVSKVSVVARDITKIKEANEALALERILLRTIIDNIPINIYAKDLKCEKILANRAEYEYVGAKSEREVIGKNDFGLYPPESASIFMEEDSRVLNGESILNVETRNTRWGGSQTWLLTSKVPWKNEKDEIIGLVGISIDITEQKKAQDELARKERLYRLVSENSQDVISIQKLDGTFEYISPSCIGLHGYTPEEMIGRNGLEFVPAEDSNRILIDAPLITEKMSRNEPVEPSQFRIITKNRGLIWVENVIKPVFEAGVLTRFQSTVRDISARKAYEEALQEAKLKAEAATLAKSQFLSMMSHEIRTPMNGIIGLTNILISEKPRLDQIEHLNLLKFSCDNLFTIINDILDFSKVESGKMELENIPFDITDILRHYKKLFEDRASRKGIGLVLNLDARLPKFVSGDPVRIGQIINNLVGNAIKFTDHGFVEISVQLVEKSKKMCLIHFSVRDTGIGIPEDKISSVFEGFSQAASDITRKFGGTGLGLSITKRLLNLMGSQINVKSKLGIGSEFEFDLRLRESTAVKTVSDEEQNLITKLEGIRLLLVEDNAVNQVVAKNFLNKWGFEISICENGEQAISLVETMNYDLVLMDIQMPVMDGYEATKIIRRKPHPYFKRLPIIALTADVTPEVQAKALDAGMNDMMSKPFQPQELRSLLQKYSSFSSAKHRANENWPIGIEVFSGGDHSLEIELRRLFAMNLSEIRNAAENIMSVRGHEAFSEILHKGKTTLKILNNEALDKTLDRFNNAVDDFFESGVSIPQQLIADLLATIKGIESRLVPMN